MKCRHFVRCADNERAAPTGARYEGSMTTTHDRGYDALDRAWQVFHRTDPEFGRGRLDGLSNHGPMAAEALMSLGYPEQIRTFVASYRPKLRPLVPGEVIPPRDRHAAVGDPSRRADWIATYEARIEREGPAAVVSAEVPGLAEGAMAGALHALIRTGHALRGLGRADTPTRRRELAHALGYWSARHQPMPGRIGSRAKAGQDVGRTLALVPRARRARDGLIFERVEAVRRTAGFMEVIERVDLDAMSFDATVTAMVDASAHLYLSTPKSRFVYLHGITGSSALRLIGPWLDDAGRRALLGGTVHALVALHSTHAREHSVMEQALDPVEIDPAAAARQASSSRDDHTIKLVEALLREHRHVPRVVLGHVLQHRLRA